MIGGVAYPLQDDWRRGLSIADDWRRGLSMARPSGFRMIMIFNVICDQIFNFITYITF